VMRRAARRGILDDGASPVACPRDGRQRLLLRLSELGTVNMPVGSAISSPSIQDCYKAVRQAVKVAEAREKEDPTAMRALGTS
jgi:hypothetical protein